MLGARREPDRMKIIYAILLIANALMLLLNALEDKDEHRKFLCVMNFVAIIILTIWFCLKGVAA